MGRLLLAVYGGKPHQSTVRYTLQLCNSLQARLHVLSVAPTNRTDHMDPLVRQLEESGIPYRMQSRIGNPIQEIVSYLDRHHEIELAIYDFSDDNGIPGMRVTRTLPKTILKGLRVPVVTVRPQRRLLKTAFIKIISIGIKEVTLMAKLFAFLKRKAPPVTEAETNTAETAATEKEQPARLVVVGQESRFSESIISYSLDMARRMDYQILALNTAPLSCETFRMFSNSRAQVCQDFEKLSEENALRFKERCDAAGIAFTHVVKFVETNDALEQIQSEFDDIGFIVSEPEEERVQTPDVMEQAPHHAAPIRVYSVI